MEYGELLDFHFEPAEFQKVLWTEYTKIHLYESVEKSNV